MVIPLEISAYQKMIEDDMENLNIHIFFKGIFN